ncbi:MAG TPA: hypothetical protein VFJ12_03505 [Segeticoccus sp.]|nr:hypothetical protein [Segeticoccus sp.]
MAQLDTWEPAGRWTLRVGQVGPVHDDPHRSGSAALTVARMLADPVFARWVTAGIDAPEARVDPRTEAERFTAHSEQVRHRTNGWRGADGRPNLPWPSRADTSPFGARVELEHGAARAGARYVIAPLRRRNGDQLREVHAGLLERVGDGLPALLAVGDRWTPRHWVLVIDAPGGGALTVYDPADGSVRVRGRHQWVGRSLQLGGWDLPWVVVLPRNAPVRGGVVVQRWRAVRTVPRGATTLPSVRRVHPQTRLCQSADQPLGTGTSSTSRTSTPVPSGLST